MQKVEFTTGEQTESKEGEEKKILSGEELSKQLERLLQDKANNQRVRDWAEVCETHHSYYIFRIKDAQVIYVQRFVVCFSSG